MDSNSFVSVIIIFLNTEQFIAEAIESVLAQTHRYWELLLVDDGSSDGSISIAQQYVARYPDTIRYLEHPGHENRGMSASRNLGICHASGTYLAFLDADDRWVPQTLTEQVAILDAHPRAAMVYGPYLRWYSWSRNPEDRNRDCVQALRTQHDTLIEPPTLVSLFIQDEGTLPTGPLLRRDAVVAVGGYEDTFQGMYEDQVLRTKMCLRFPVFLSSRCWYWYRQHARGNCAVAVQHGEHYPARKRFLIWCTRYLAAQGISDPHLSRILRKELWRCEYPGLYQVVAVAQDLVLRPRTTALKVVHRILQPASHL